MLAHPLQVLTGVKSVLSAHEFIVFKPKVGVLEQVAYWQIVQVDLAGLDVLHVGEDAAHVLCHAREIEVA